MGSVVDAINPIKAITGAVGGVVDSITGDSPESNQSQTSTREIGQEDPRLTEILSSINALGGSYEKAGMNENDLALARARRDRLSNAFHDGMINFATGSSNPTAEQLNQATRFVDDTYTRAAETQYQRLLNQAQTQQSERAAAMGRNSQDLAYQREFAGVANQAAQDIANQRGGMIAQRADELSYARPMQTLGFLGQGSQFFNDQLQQAFNNRLAVANLYTAPMSLFNQQQLTRGTTSGQQSQTMSPTLGNQISGMGQAIGAGVQGIKGLGDVIKMNNAPAPTPFVGGAAQTPSLGSFNLGGMSSPAPAVSSFGAPVLGSKPTLGGFKF